jgi:hypothetical protein
MIFKGASTNSGFIQQRKYADDIRAANATPINPMKFFSVPSGEMKQLTFNNRLGATAVICAINQRDALLRSPSYVGVNIVSANTITISNISPSIVGGNAYPGMNYIYNAAQDWLKAGVKFRLQGSANNDGKTFLATAVTITGANMVINIDTVNGSSATNEVIASTTPIKVIPFQCVEIMDVLDGDSISIDLKANNIMVENSVDFYVYTLTVPSASAINAIRAYIIY